MSKSLFSLLGQGLMMRSRLDKNLQFSCLNLPRVSVGMLQAGFELTTY